MTMLRLARFRSVRITSIWRPGLSAPTTGGSASSVTSRAQRSSGVRVFVSVYAAGSGTAADARRPGRLRWLRRCDRLRALPYIDDLIIGNEPNLNRFWLPQFRAQGENVAAPAYLSLLALTYDAVKSADPSVRVWGGALAPRGIDRPNTGRDTHSPTKFIADLGAAYRASGRTSRIMDGLAIHPTANSSIAPTFARELDVDRDRGLQQARRPRRQRVRRHRPARLDAPDPLRGVRRRDHDPGRQGVALLRRRADDDAAGRRDEAGGHMRGSAGARVSASPPSPGSSSFTLRTRLRSRRGSPVSSTPTAHRKPAIRSSAIRWSEHARGRSHAVPGLELPVVTATTLRYPTRVEIRRSGIRVRLRCSLDCVYSVRLRKLPSSSTTRAKRGRARRPARDRRPRPRPRRTRELLLHRLAAPPREPGFRADQAAEHTRSAAVEGFLRFPVCGKSVGDGYARPRVGPGARRLQQLRRTRSRRRCRRRRCPFRARAARQRARRIWLRCAGGPRVCRIRALAAPTPR